VSDSLLMSWPSGLAQGALRPWRSQFPGVWLCYVLRSGQERGTLCRALPHETRQRFGQCRGVIGWLTTASARDQVASQPSSALPMISSTEGSYISHPWPGGRPHPAGGCDSPSRPHVRAPGVEQPDQRSMRSYIDHLGLRDVRRGAASYGQPHAGPRVRVMAIDDNFHSWMLSSPRPGVVTPARLGVVSGATPDPRLGGRAAFPYRVS
jgi:hypothetical protein